MVPMRRSQDWLPSIFNDFFENEGFNRVASTAPAVNIIENDKEYKIEVAAPGMTKEHFNIRIDEDNYLIVSMEKKEEQNNEPKKDEKYLRREFSYSKFEQALALPDNIIKEKIEASMEHGVLHITLPKDISVPERPKVQRIDIK